MDVVDELVSSFTRQFNKQDLFALLMKHRVPCAPVRTLMEVVNDPHLHQRGMLQWIDHPESAASSCSRARCATTARRRWRMSRARSSAPSNEDVLSGWLGLSEGRRRRGSRKRA